MVRNGKWQLANDKKDKTKQNKNIRFGSFISLVCKVGLNNVLPIKLGVPSKGFVYGDISL